MRHKDVVRLPAARQHNDHPRVVSIDVTLPVAEQGVDTVVQTTRWIVSEEMARRDRPNRTNDAAAEIGTGVQIDTVVRSPGADLYGQGHGD